MAFDFQPMAVGGQRCAGNPSGLVGGSDDELPDDSIVIISCLPRPLPTAPLRPRLLMTCCHQAVRRHSPQRDQMGFPQAGNTLVVAVISVQGRTARTAIMAQHLKQRRFALLDVLLECHQMAAGEAATAVTLKA